MVINPFIWCEESQRWIASGRYSIYKLDNKWISNSKSIVYNIEEQGWKFVKDEDERC